MGLKLKLEKFNIELIVKPSQKLKSLLNKQFNSVEQEDLAGIYEIPITNQLTDQFF